MNKKKKNNIKNGFTLIELLLYTGLLALILLVISAFLAMSLESKVKNRTISEVEQQGEEVMQIMTQTVRNSTILNSPTIGASGASLSVNVTDGAKSPTIFTLFSGKIQVQEGLNAPIDISSNKVVITNLNFQNVSRPSTPGIITINFTVSYNDPNGRNEYQFTKNFYDSASRRY